MAPLLRKYLVCFYCGHRSQQRQEGTIRQWLCNSCDAVNYLDENGEITDHVPPSPTTKVRYADPPPLVSTNPLSPSSPPDDNGPFCATCLKNQHVLTQSLATYLPSPTDERYPAFVAAYPKYRQRLEERYPQVCSECEAGVTKRIRQADYMANTAYLGWKIKATRNTAGRKPAQRWGWRSFLIFVGGVNWYSSLLLQGLWHIHAAKAQKRVGPGWKAEPFLWSCFALKDNPDCVPFAAYLARIGLAQALMSIWWNNQLWRKPLGTKVRLVALDDYYALQFLILSVRVGAWWVSQSDVIISLNQESLRASHLFMLAFLVLSTVLSLRMVKVSQEPRLSFRMDTERSATRPEKKPQAIPPVPALAPIQPTHPTPLDSQITNLAPLPSPPHIGSLPSPPAEDVDEMEWTPSQEEKLFNPTAPPTTTIGITDPSQTPSPFYGRLPPPPISPAARLRNPPYQPQLRKIPDDKKKALVNGMRGSSLSDNEDNSDNAKGKRHSIAMANPRFFPSDDYTRDTGLESLFDTVFTLGDPPEVKGQQQAETAGQAGPKIRTGRTGPARLWKEWLVRLLLAAPVIAGLYWAIMIVWGMRDRITGIKGRLTTNW